jgi:hypothetical protein
MEILKMFKSIKIMAQALMLCNKAFWYGIIKNDDKLFDEYLKQMDDKIKEFDTKQYKAKHAKED